MCPHEEQELQPWDQTLTLASSQVTIRSHRNMAERTAVQALFVLCALSSPNLIHSFILPFIHLITFIYPHSWFNYHLQGDDSQTCLSSPDLFAEIQTPVSSWCVFSVSYRHLNVCKAKLIFSAQNHSLLFISPPLPQCRQPAYSPLENCICLPAKLAGPSLNP